METSRQRGDAVEGCQSTKRIGEIPVSGVAACLFQLSPGDRAIAVYGCLFFIVIHADVGS